MACEPGWNGGLQQVFSLEVRKEIRGRVLASLHSQPIPHFTVTGLSPGNEYFLGVFAENAQGIGPIVNLAYHTPIDIAEKRLSADAVDSENGTNLFSENKFISNITLMILCVSSGVILIILIVLIILKVKGVSCVRRGNNTDSKLIYTRTSIVDESADSVPLGNVKSSSENTNLDFAGKINFGILFNLKFFLSKPIFIT